MISGYTLRGRVDAFQDVLAEVEGFLDERGLLDDEATELLETIKERCNDLFYFIPLKEQADE